MDEWMARREDKQPINAELRDWSEIDELSIWGG